MLYEVHYRTEHKDAPTFWIERGCLLIIQGELKHDEHLVLAGQDIFRYEAWEDENLETYYNSIHRYKRTKRSYNAFVSRLKVLLNQEGTNE